MNKAEIIKDVALKLGTQAQWLDALINFETAGTYDPLIQNFAGSSARGLIQVIDSTAQSVFGEADSAALVSKYPTFHSQMYNVVLPYLQQFAPFPSKQSLYMAVFFPAARNVPPQTTFRELYVKLYGREKGLSKYAIFERQNPGITTVQDYISFVDRRVKRDKLILAGRLSLLVAAAIGATGYALWRVST